jgi:hypothetical protein
VGIEPTLGMPAAFLRPCTAICSTTSSM